MGYRSRDEKIETSHDGRYMRSNEIARLAGVTVRTLRHYHALGLLAEPPRSENGYREYGPEDLVTLLRIKRLASLGFSLGQVGEMMRCDVVLDDWLDSLDEELDARIDELKHQKAIIAHLRAEGTRFDLPPRYARFISALVRGGADCDAVDLEVDTVLLTDAVLPSGVGDFVHAYYQSILADDGIDTYVDLNSRFLALNEDSTEAERGESVRGFVDFLRPRLRGILSSKEAALLNLPQESVDIIDLFDAATLNPVQRAVGDEVAEQLGRELVADGILSVEAAKNLGVLA